MKILVTAFEPFGGDAVNPSLEIIKALPKKINHCEIITLALPVVAYHSLEVVDRAIGEHNPDIILSLGLAGGISDIQIEKVGINLNDFRISDNAGNQFENTAIFADGDKAYFVDLPVKKMVQELHNKGIPARISYSAGTFICNHLLYGVAYLLDKKYSGKKNGFIHLPYLPHQVAGRNGVPSMNQQDMLTAIITAIEVIDHNEISLLSGTIY